MMENRAEPENLRYLLDAALEGLQGEQSVAEICRREGLNTNIYYRWMGPPMR